tara:strand:- start:141 stop:641 length:501 start_codon:yes stop_codon:yes gene_type:complete
MIFPDDTTQPLQQQLEERDCTIENLKDSLNTIQLKIDSLKYDYVEEKSEILFFWNTLAKIESSGGIHLLGDNGKAKGPLQIHKGLVIDVNKMYNLSYTHDDMFDYTTSQYVGSLYLNMLAKRHYNIYKSLPTKFQLGRMWNGGFGLYNDNATLAYYNKLKSNYNIN